MLVVHNSYFFQLLIMLVGNHAELLIYRDSHTHRDIKEIEIRVEKKGGINIKNIEKKGKS